MYDTIPTPAMDLRWMDRAACKDSDVDMFGQDSRPALEVCEGCPVKTPCLEYAIASGPLLAGVWGGTTQRQRKLRKAPSQCRNGHELTEATYTIRKDGKPRCLVCHREGLRRYREAKRLAS